MKNKIIIPVVILILSGYNLLAQTLEPLGKASFGIYGGINFQNINGKDMSNNKLSNGMVTRFHGGISEQIPVATDFFVEIGLQYTGKGGKCNVMYYNTPETRMLNLHYIELPINLLYRPLLGTGHFLLGFGPYFGYALSGKAKFSGDAYTATPDVLFEKTINTSNPNDLVYYKHLDVGANFFFGYELANGINFKFDSQLGLVSINSKNTYYPNSKLSEKNTGFGLSVGYRF